MAESLSDYVRKNSKFLTINDGDTFIGTFHGFSVIPSSWDPEKDTVQYKLKYPDGIAVTWQKGSPRVAKTIEEMNFQPGDSISIKRTGSGTKDTRYEITKPA